MGCVREVTGCQWGGREKQRGDRRMAGVGRGGDKAGPTLQRHSPVVLLQSGSKPWVTSQLQGPHVGCPHHPRGHGCASLGTMELAHRHHARVPPQCHL